MTIASLTYVKVKGKKFTWYVPVKKNPITHLHVSYRSDKNGYAGRDLKFNLVDGTVDIVTGPYCLEDYGPEYFIEDIGRHPEQIVDEHIDEIILKKVK